MTKLAGINVSRETLTALADFQHEAIRWNQKINLFSKSTIEDFWDRHIVDSAQLSQYTSVSDKTWADFGSGGGLPGVVLAIMARELAPSLSFTLVESDQRKAAFLRHAKAKFKLAMAVSTNRVENHPPLNADVISARAFTDLNQILRLALPHMKDVGRLILLKGRSAQEEIEVAKENWDFDVEIHRSLTDNQSSILEITNVVQRI